MSLKNNCIIINMFVFVTPSNPPYYMMSQSITVKNERLPTNGLASCAMIIINNGMDGVEDFIVICYGVSKETWDGKKSIVVLLGGGAYAFHLNVGDLNCKV